MLKKQFGFTLIELLIVVAIIAILAAIAIPNFLAAQTRAKVAGVMKEQQTIATGLEAYQVDNTAYPRSSDSIYFGTYGRLDVCRIARLAQITTPIAYITKVPMDVFNLRGNSTTLAGLVDMTGTWDRAYPYWEPKVFDAYKANSSYDNMFAENPDERTKKGRWALMSFGPDQNYSINVGTWPGRIMQYDPTNGIVTNGDVWRFGP
ncbi:MAG: prepilin-type N-terminal cleavage/methylation domain-containing protein [bacterium]